MTITQFIQQLQRSIISGDMSGDDQVFTDLWTWEDVEAGLDGFYDALTYHDRYAKARQIWGRVVGELETYDEYPDANTIRMVIGQHIEADKKMDAI